jgi:hypothetical protein
MNDMQWSMQQEWLHLFVTAAITLAVVGLVVLSSRYLTRWYRQWRDYSDE